MVKKMVKLWKGSTRRVTNHNFHVYRHSSDFAKTEKTKGYNAAVKEMDNIVLSKAGIPKK